MQRRVFAVPRIITHNVFDKRFGNACIHAVHAHMVAVIGCPAECKLGKVARADNKAVQRICKIHQHKGAHARLCVFVNNVVTGFVVPDVAKMRTHRIRNRNRVKRYTEGIAKSNGILFRVFGGAETGHGDGVNKFAVNAHKVACLCRSKQRKCGIQSARNADDRAH